MVCGEEAQCHRNSVLVGAVLYNYYFFFRGDLGPRVFFTPNQDKAEYIASVGKSRDECYTPPVPLASCQA